MPLPTETDVEVFDELSYASQLAMLAHVGKAVRDPREPCPDRTVLSDGTIAAVYWRNRVDIANETSILSALCPPDFFGVKIRTLAVRAFVEPHPECALPLEIEHIIPIAKGGSSAESNLWLSCPLCNRFKADRTSARDPDSDAAIPLFNPRTQRWSEHFRWSEDGLRAIGLTPKESGERTGAAARSGQLGALVSSFRAEAGYRTMNALLRSQARGARR